nr:5'-nucleotidase-like [Penaeus vannamei]
MPTHFTPPSSTSSSSHFFPRLLLHFPLFLLLLLLVVVSPRTTLAQDTKDDLELTLLHLNDFHARFEETNVYSGRCTEGDREKNRCYGGFHRISTSLQHFRSTKPNVLFLAAGDYYQGTVWYTIHKWRALAHFLNLIGQDAMVKSRDEVDTQWSSARVSSHVDVYVLIRALVNKLCRFGANLIRHRRSRSSPNTLEKYANY